MKKLIAVFLFLSQIAYARELKQEVNLASKLEKDSSKIGKSTEVIDQYVLKAEKPTFLDEALWNVEGLHVKRLSGAEGTLSIYSRGMRSTDSVLAFDEVQFKDPSDTQGSSAPMLQDILLTDSDNIEIIKGASSSVNGSTVQGALLDLERPYSDKRRLSYTQEFGSLRRYKEVLSAVGSFYRLDVLRLDTDRYENTTLSGSLRIGNERLSIEPLMYHISSVAQLHDAPFILGGIAFKDARNALDKRENELALYGVKSKLDLADNVSLHNLISYTETDRRFVFGSFDSDGSFGGKDWTIDSFVTVKHSEILSSAVGFKHETQNLDISQVGVSDERNASAGSNEFYFEEKADAWEVPILFSIRHSNQHGSKSALTYDFSGAYPAGNFKLASHFGTGFRYPSLYERHGAVLTAFGIFDLGNPKLSPEKSWTWDGTLQYSDKVNTLGVTPFYTHVSNAIVFETDAYSNTSVARKSHGIEAFYERFLIGAFSYRANYTYTLGSNLIDIPKHELGNSILFCKAPWTGNLRIAYQTSKRYAIFNLDTFLADTVREPSGVLIGATLSYTLNKNAEIFFKMDNLFNRTYTDGGYAKHSLEAYGGIKISV